MTRDGDSDAGGGPWGILMHLRTGGHRDSDSCPGLELCPQKMFFGASAAPENMKRRVWRRDRIFGYNSKILSPRR